MVKKKKIDKEILDSCVKMICNSDLNSYFMDVVDCEQLIIESLKQEGFEENQKSAKYYYDYDKNSLLLFKKFYDSLKKENNKTYDRLKYLVFYDLNKMKESPADKYVLYTPINLFFEKLQKFRYGEFQIEFLNTENIDVSIFDDDFYKQRNFEKSFSKKDFSNFTFIKISGRSRNLNYFSRETHKIILFICGVFCLSDSYGIPFLEIHNGSTLTILRRFMSFCFVNSKLSHLLNGDEREIPKNLIRLDDFGLRSSKQIFNTFQRIESKDLISLLFAEYFSGMLETQMHNSFFCFWQILEIGCCIQDSETNQTVIKILECLLFKKIETERNKLQRFYDLRNDIVHKGKVEIFEHDINSVKAFAEEFIDFHLRFFQKFKEKEIKDFFRNIRRDEKETNDLIDSLNIVKSFKKFFHYSSSNKS